MVSGSLGRMKTPTPMKRIPLWVKEAKKKTKRANEKEGLEWNQLVIDELLTATAAVLRRQLLLTNNSMGMSVLEGIKILERRRPVKKFTGEDGRILKIIWHSSRRQLIFQDCQRVTK